MSDRILVIGGSGVFGARIAIALAGVTGVDLIVAGRDPARTEAFCRAHGGRAVRLDRRDPALAGILAGLAPFAVIDAAGPFQA
ncbi:MAG: hypothetical protein HC844_09550 [Tabrizicola sp.]|nr:hypothetical protein [Tabrizicola sp.]